MATWEKIEDIEIWRDSRNLCDKIWNIIQSTSLKNDFRLRDQMSGSSGSIMDNIAEGFGREGNKEFKLFLSYSIGSCAELSSQLYRCLDRSYIDENAFNELNNEVLIITKRIKTLRNYLKDTPFRGNKFKEPFEQYLIPKEDNDLKK